MKNRIRITALLLSMALAAGTHLPVYADSEEAGPNVSDISAESDLLQTGSISNSGSEDDSVIGSDPAIGPEDQSVPDDELISGPDSVLSPGADSEILPDSDSSTGGHTAFNSTAGNSDDPADGDNSVSDGENVPEDPPYDPGPETYDEGQEPVPVYDLTENASAEALPVLRQIHEGSLDGLTVRTVQVDAEAAADNFRGAVQNALDGIDTGSDQGQPDGQDLSDENVIIRVVVPKGTYSLDGRQLEMSSNTILDCRGDGALTPYDTSDDHMTDGSGVVITPVYGNGCNVRCGTSSDASSGYDFYRNMTILGGTFNGGGVTGSQIRFGHASNVRLIGLQVLDNVGAHHVEIGAVDGFLATDCAFSGYEDTDSNTRSIEAIQLDITHREDDNFKGFGLHDDLPTINATVSSCTFDGVCRGVGSHHAVLGSPYDHIRIINNTFRNIPDRCINCMYMTGSEVSGNVMENVVSGIFACGMTPKQFYQPNQDEPGHSGNALYTSPETLKASLVIKNNTIRLNADDLPDPQYASNKYGIKAGGDNVSASDASSAAINKDIRLGTNPYPVPAGSYYLSGVTISGNKISAPSDYGSGKTIDYGIIAWYLKDSAISSNTVDLNGCNLNKEASAGIKMNYSSGLTIKGNTVKGITNGTASSGIYATDSSSNLQIQSNTVANTANNGITLVRITDGASNLLNNTVSGAGAFGIKAHESNVKAIKGNTVSNCTKNGIFIYRNTTTGNGRAESIESNILKDNAKPQISSSGSVKYIIGNTFTGDSAVSISCGIAFTSKTCNLNVKQTKAAPFAGTAANAAWSTSNKNVVTVDQKGNITGVKTGKAVITAKSRANGVSTTCTVTVKKPVSQLTFAVKTQNYTGKALTPAVTVKDGTTVLKKGTHYTVKYSANTNPGTATASVTMLGYYTGTKKVTFKIVLKKPVISKLTNVSGRKLTVTWPKDAAVGGHQIRVITGKKTKNTTIAGAAKTAGTVTGLLKGSTYKVYVRSYKKIGTKTYYSAWSAAKSIKITK